MITLLTVAALQFPMAEMRTSRDLLRALPAVEASETTVANVRLWIAPDGKVKECQLLRYAGIESIANEMCARVEGLRFKPARDELGDKSYAFYTTSLSVFPDDARKLRDKLQTKLSAQPLPSDILIDVEELSGPLADDPRVSTRVKIDETGSVTYCEHGYEQREELAAVACQQARLHGFEIRKAENGQPVQYVRGVSFEFRAES